MACALQVAGREVDAEPHLVVVAVGESAREMARPDAVDPYDELALVVHLLREVRDVEGIVVAQQRRVGLQNQTGSGRFLTESRIVVEFGGVGAVVAPDADDLHDWRFLSSSTMRAAKRSLAQGLMTVRRLLEVGEHPLAFPAAGEDGAQFAFGSRDVEFDWSTSATASGRLRLTSETHGHATTSGIPWYSIGAMRHTTTSGNPSRGGFECGGSRCHDGAGCGEGLVGLVADVADRASGDVLLVERAVEPGHAGHDELMPGKRSASRTMRGKFLRISERRLPASRAMTGRLSSPFRLSEPPGVGKRTPPGFEGIDQRIPLENGFDPVLREVVALEGEDDEEPVDITLNALHAAFARGPDLRGDIMKVRRPRSWAQRAIFMLNPG